MGLCRRKNALVTFFMLSILSASLQLGAMRPLGIQLIKQEGLLLHSLPKGPVTPSSPNPCTYVPEKRLRDLQIEWDGHGWECCCTFTSCVFQTFSSGCSHGCLLPLLKALVVKIEVLDAASFDLAF
ncbi:hypothetical protein OIU84_013649 [Salix udensis]|uniref:Uncharacterized protein n=1 Tax=Salix udensis TaxID=889485 RepID=A0AAD6JJQ8_9ROSI|nr:hypothetical protein OIU84_013649 [Salix udensis]